MGRWYYLRLAVRDRRPKGGGRGQGGQGRGEMWQNRREERTVGGKTRAAAAVARAGGRVTRRDRKMVWGESLVTGRAALSDAGTADSPADCSTRQRGRGGAGGRGREGGRRRKEEKGGEKEVGEGGWRDGERW